MKIFISCSSQDSIEEIYKEETRKLVEEISKDNDLVFGSSKNGLMGICYEAFLKNNRHITGICYEFYKDLIEELTLDDIIMVKTLNESNLELIKNSDIILVLPGAYGTLSEAISTIELVRTKVYDKQIIFYNINNFYDELFILFKKMYKEKTTKNNYQEIITVCSSKEEVIKELEKKHGNK